MTFAKTIRLIALTAFGAALACAGSITVTLDQPNQTGGPGDTLMFFGVIANTGADTEYLNSDSLNVSATTGDFTTDDGPFFANAPLSLASSASTADIELFDVLIVSPFPDAFTSYTGLFTILGGADGGSSHRSRDRFQRVRGERHAGTFHFDAGPCRVCGLRADPPQLDPPQLNLIWAGRPSEYCPVLPCRANGSDRESEGSKHPIRRRAPSPDSQRTSFGDLTGQRPGAGR